LGNGIVKRETEIVQIPRINRWDLCHRQPGDARRRKAIASKNGQARGQNYTSRTPERSRRALSHRGAKETGAGAHTTTCIGAASLGAEKVDRRINCCAEADGNA
jgi:hypothetical protein